MYTCDTYYGFISPEYEEIIDDTKKKGTKKVVKKKKPQTKISVCILFICNCLILLYSRHISCIHACIRACPGFIAIVIFFSYLGQNV